jgi:hypothetical protein
MFPHTSENSCKLRKEFHDYYHVNKLFFPKQAQHVFIITVTNSHDYVVGKPANVIGGGRSGRQIRSMQNRGQHEVLDV